MQPAMPVVLHTPLVDLLGCTVPVLAAGMGGVARSALVVAVSRAGGFGCLGMVREPVALLEQEIRRVRAGTRQDFGVNLIPAATDKALLDAQIACCIRERVPVVCLFWDVDAARIRRLREAGIRVMHQVGSVHDAEQAVRAGVDVLVAQGYEAGGHVRGQVGIMALLPEIVAMAPVPVVAAGGMASGQALVAALALGAQGVWCGSLFLATHEANAHPLHRQRICQAQAGDTVHTYRFFRNWPMAAAVRVLPNAVTEGSYDHLRNQREPAVIAHQDGQPVYLFSTDSPLQDAVGDIAAMAIYAGQSCGQVRDITSAGERVRRLVSEASATLQALGATGLDAPVTAPLASSPCGEPGPDAAGMARAASGLQALLATVRGNARLAAEGLLHLHDATLRAHYRQAHRTAADACCRLRQCLGMLGLVPDAQAVVLPAAGSTAPGERARLRRLCRHQRRVVRCVEALLPDIADTTVYHALCHIRTRHVEDASRLLACLARRGNSD